ncbi:MAG: TadE/TadG family type IV pilus assembly protein [Methylocystis sp.]
MQSHPANRPGFAADARGSTAVEFAIICLPLVFLILGIIEIGWGNFTQSRMDAAVQSTARLIMTGVVQNTQVAGQPLSAQEFRDQILCPKLPSTMNCNDVFVNVSVFAEPTSLTAPSPYMQFINAAGTGLVTPALDNSKNGYCVGANASYVVVDVVYPLPLLTTGYLAAGASTYNGYPVRMLQSTATFKNEPFTITGTAGC